MSESNMPTPEEMWQLLLQEQERTRKLEAETERLHALISGQTEIGGHAGKERRPSARMSRGRMLAAAGATGAALVGMRANSASAQAPPAPPGLYTYSAPRRVVGQAMAYNQQYGPFDATTGGVPTGASAAYCAVQSNMAGILTLYPDSSAGTGGDTGIANYSVTGNNQLNMLYMMVPISATGLFRIHSFITGQVFVDVWGYVY